MPAPVEHHPTWPCPLPDPRWAAPAAHQAGESGRARRLRAEGVFSKRSAALRRAAVPTHPPRARPMRQRTPLSLPVPARRVALARAGGLALGAGMVSLGLHGTARAQAYPSKQVRVVISFPPGGATDILARNLGQRLSAKLGQQFVIENKPGAGGIIGLETAATCHARRLHHLPVRADQHRHRHPPVPEGLDAGGARLRHRGPAGQCAPCAEPAPLGACAHRARVRGLAEGQRRQGELRLARQRHLVPPGIRAAGSARRA